MAGKVEEREVRAFGGLGEVGDRLLEAVEIEILLHGDRKADPLEAVRNQARVDCGVGERRVRIGAVRDDERDTAASGRGGVSPRARRRRQPRLARASPARRLEGESASPKRINNKEATASLASAKRRVLSSHASPGREESPA